ncbi:MAG: winged helix-turn-helix domain-containing protein [Neomegalonema sp.]|nr:winged helix-turn-helix domain-containing protein [Neomegalonema sp.]
MKEGPDIARLAALIGDPARANMLTALMSGKALSAGELAREAGITAQTASAHLAKLEEGGLIRPRKQGRHRYFSLESPDVAQMLEAMMGLAIARGHARTRTGPKDPALREARVCYNHLAGARGVQVFDSLMARGLLIGDAQNVRLSDAGTVFLAQFGLALPKDLPSRPLCRACLDWSARRSHLAGVVGRALLARFEELGWARRVEGTRVIRFSRAGQAEFDAAFPLS